MAKEIIQDLTDHSKIEINGVTIRCEKVNNGINCWTVDRQSFTIKQVTNITVQK